MSNEASFTISVTGASGEQYRGAFKTKIRLSARDIAKMDMFRRDILGPSPEGQAPSADAMSTARVYSKLWTHLIETPEWWKAKGNGLDLEDEEPVLAILKEIQTREKEMLAKLTKEGDEAKKDLVEEVKKEG